MAKLRLTTQGKERRRSCLTSFALQSRSDEFFEASFKKLGGEIVDKQSIPRVDRDYKGQLTAIRIPKNP